MPGRLPEASDFPPSLNLTIIPPPTSSPRPTNVLILLHGLGDTKTLFVQLGKQMSLPETVCIALQGPTPLPFELGGFHWGDDIVFDQATGQMDMDTGFSKASKMIRLDLFDNVLVQKCGYAPREVMFLGLGQGGMAALASLSSTTEEFGGVVSIGGPLSSPLAAMKTPPTPVLLLGGSSKSLVTRPTLETMRRVFKSLEYHKWKKVGDSMPSNREEMLPIMRFFASRLRSRQGVPEGSVEVN